MDSTRGCRRMGSLIAQQRKLTQLRYQIQVNSKRHGMGKKCLPSTHIPHILALDLQIGLEHGLGAYPVSGDPNCPMTLLWSVL